MSVRVRRTRPSDYVEVAKWWNEQKFPVIPRECLSETGLIAESDKGRSVAAVWLYRTDSRIAWLEWMVANPEVPPGTNERSEALDALIETAHQEARAAGAQIIFTSISNKRLKTRLERHGFKEGDTGMTNMVKRLM